jgi:hypothetical protein
MEYEITNGLQKTYFSYNLVDTENCPDLQATLWFETPDNLDVQD